MRSPIRAARTVWLLAAVCSPCAPALAQSDECATATVILGEGAFPFNTSTATSSGANASCNPTSNSSDVWYRWSPLVDGGYRFFLCDTTQFDSVLALYDACGGVELACEDLFGCNGGFENVEISVPGLLAGTDYWIQVDGWNGGGGPGVLEIRLNPGGMGGETCVGAQPLQGTGLWPWSLLGSTWEGWGEPFCYDNNPYPFGGHDVWFAWTATQAGYYEFRSCEASIALYAGQSCPPGFHIGCMNIGCSPFDQTFSNRIRTTAQAGEGFLIRIGSTRVSSGGVGDLEVSLVTPVPNDECTDALAISGIGSFPYTTVGASDSLQRPDCAFQAILDVWFEWTTPPFTGFYRFTGQEGVAVYDDCGGAQLACSNEELPLEVMLDGSTTYRVQVFSTAIEQSGEFVVQSLQPPPNDRCFDAIDVLGEAVIPYSNIDATTDGVPAVPCTPQLAQDVWYRWTAEATGYHEIGTCPTQATEQVIEVYLDVDCPTMPPPPPLVAHSSTPTDCGGTAVRFLAQEAQTYLVRLGGPEVVTFPTPTVPIEAEGELRFVRFEPRAEGECENAELITDVGAFPFDTSLALPDLTFSCAGAADVWFRWRPPVGAAYRFYSAASTVCVYRACGDLIGCGSNHLVLPMPASMDYHIKVRSLSMAQGIFTIQRNALPAPAQPNESCETATAIWGSGVHAYDLGAAFSGAPDTPGCSFGADLWWNWVAPKTASFVVETCSLSIHARVLGVYAGASCFNLGLVECASGNCGAQARIEFSAVEGQSFFFRLGTGASSPSTGTAGLFRIRESGVNQEVGQVFCTALPNAAGSVGQIEALGSNLAADQDLRLRASGLPPNVLGLFFFGSNHDSTPMGNGIGCVSGQLFRGPFQQADGSGVFQEVQAWSVPGASQLVPGTTWYFQTWYRDGVGAGFNTSNARRISIQI